MDLVPKVVNSRNGEECGECGLSRKVEWKWESRSGIEVEKGKDSSMGVAGSSPECHPSDRNTHSEQCISSSLYYK